MNRLLNAILLTGIISCGLWIPTIAQADITDTAAINNNTSAVNSLTSAITAANPQGDLTRKQLATAIINYEANARMQEYQLNRELLFMGAPGIYFAVGAGSAIGALVKQAGGGTVISDSALRMANQTTAYSLGLFTNSPTINLDGVQINTNAGLLTTDPGQFYNLNNVGNFINNGDMSSIIGLNPASIMQRNNLEGTVSPAQAQIMINILSAGFPSIDPTLQSDLKNNAQTPIQGNDKEAVSNIFAENAITGLSASAFSDIVARRTPQAQGQASMMQVMEQYSAQRFTNPDWYRAISAASEAALLREIAHMMAYNSWMQYQQYKIMDQQLALLASLNAVMAKVNAGLANLSSQMAASTAQAQASANQMQQQMQQQQNNGNSGQ